MLAGCKFRVCCVSMQQVHLTSQPRHYAVRCAAADLPPGWKEVTDDTGKAYYYNVATGVTQWQKPMVERFASGRGDNSARSLTPSSTWRIKLDLTAPGTAATVSVTANLRFAEDEGYEPPQGFVLVESCSPEGALTLGQQKARWLLSEDPEDRKDSLWIWGLFSEPLYPFILFELELAEPLALSESVSIPAGPLYFQVDHRRKDGSVQLGEGAVTYKVQEELNADLVGLSQFSYSEPRPCGTISFLDTVESISKSFI
eukprot:6934175-Prymnesium_polylepis.1